MASRPDVYHRAEELAAGLPPLLVSANRVAATISQGVHGRRRVGQGETFWQFRQYHPSDSVHQIDWRQSAKTQPVFVRQTEWEAAQCVWIWRDASGSMDYRSRRRLPLKSERADLLSLALASLLIRGGEYVALLGAENGPATGRSALNQMALTIEHNQLPRGSVPPLQRVPRYARMVLFSDFFTPLEEIKSAIEPYANGGVRGHIIQVLDPAEEKLPFKGRIRFVGMENEGDVLFGRVEGVRENYGKTFENHRAGLDALVRTAGWTMTTHRTDKSPESILLPLYLLLSESVGH
ncbi:MAG: DUF58 domain-containing protein [Rhodospirillaceae bacterium]|jgi:uncharacterized protein (DUF58 family)